MIKSRDHLNLLLEIVGMRVGLGLIAISVFSLVAMLVIGVADSIGTKMGFPFPGAKELIEEFMVVTVICAIPYVKARPDMGHLSLNLVTASVSPRTKLILDTLSDLVGFAVFFLLSWQSFHLVKRAIEGHLYKAGDLPIPMVYSHAVIFIGFLVAALYWALCFIAGVLAATKLMRSSKK